MEQILEFPAVSSGAEDIPGLPSRIPEVSDQHGRSLDSLTREQPVLLVFLRHSGCTFCREAATDVSEQREAIEREGVTPAFVGMMDDSEFDAFLESYGLDDLPRFADPTQRLYRDFGLGKGNMKQLLGPEVWRRGMSAAAPAWLGGGGHGLGALRGDGLQMPGVFLLYQGRVIGGYRHETAAKRPDYTSLACEAR